MGLRQIIDLQAVVEHMPVFVWIYIMVIVAVFVDLFTAIHYAKTQGFPILSSKLRKTVDKLIRYFGLLFIGSAIDIIVLLIDLYPIFGLKALPFFTGMAGILLCVIEARSVIEHRDREQKKLLRKTTQSLINVFDKKSLQAIADIIIEVKDSNEKAAQELAKLEKSNKDNQGKEGEDDQ